MYRLTRLCGFALLLLSHSAFAQQTLLLKQPAVSAERLAFVYAGDIWTANRDGSQPRRLTSHPVSEFEPKFSPDGSMLAFSANYENNVDVYVMPVAGGQPKRLTWHPASDVPTGWTADGTEVTFISGRETDHGRSGQWYHVSLDGGLPVKQMEARIYRGVYDQTDERLAYIPFGSGYNGLFGGNAGWKGYRGGTTPAIQVMELADGSVSGVPGGGATNFNPMWVGDDLYFVSDRDEELFNVFRYDASSGRVQRVSNEDVWEVRAADSHDTTIVYSAGGRLKNLDTVSGVTTDIIISIKPDLPQLRRQWKSAAGMVQAADLSPTGKRAVVTARGEVFTVPLDDGSTRNISNTSAVREYFGMWSPAGDQIAFIEESPEGQELVVVDQTGVGDRRSFELGPHFYELAAWSRGERPSIAFHDNHLNLHIVELEGGDVRTVATGARRDSIEAAFSPDGRWLAYTLERQNYNRDLMLYDVESDTSTALTQRFADVAAPAFSRDGAYLYFAASTNSGPLQAGLDMTSQERPYRAGLYAIVLAADGISPLLPGSGDENGEEDEASAGDEEEDDEDTVEETRIDLDGIAERIVALPVAERNYDALSIAQDGNLYYVEAVQAGATVEPPGDDAAEANALMRFDFEEKEAQSLLQGVDTFRLSADGEHMIVTKVDGSLVVAEVADELEPEALDLDGLRILIDPKAEWRQIFDEAWRMEREFFYDPDLHGLDWQAVYDRYRPLVEHVGRREDLTHLLVEMIAEMQVGHNRAAGGDIHREEGANSGLLGANFTVENGRYRIARVYTGETWNPFLRAPLATAGNEVRAGEYILAVNGRNLSAADNIFEFLQGTANEQTTLRVAPGVNGRDARDVIVEPVTSERWLRLWHWVEDNRRQVDEATEGRVGYVYLPNTAVAGYTFFNRMFFAQIDKEAMIIDERSNGGGQAANYITEVLSRRHLSGWRDRDGEPFNTPGGALHGPKIMMIDQDAGSGGDYLPYAFRYLGIGKLLGTRTWGGLIGISANPRLIDGGSLTVPFFRFYDTDGNWTVENEGVSPDIEVALDPVATNEGRDSQLERAIDEILTQLETFTPTVPASPPAYPTELGQ